MKVQLINCTSRNKRETLSPYFFCLVDILNPEMECISHETEGYYGWPLTQIVIH